MDHLKQLKAFATLAEFGSFSRAGAVLSIAQPVQSRQIKALERELGIELFYRNGRGRRNSPLPSRSGRSVEPRSTRRAGGWPAPTSQEEET
jgi:DNA-binding transcriptional LysR family regulator